MKRGLFEELLESLHEAGAIARGELKPARVTRFAAVDTRAIRTRFGLTQLAFSRMIGVSVATLRNWEQGRRNPLGPARVLLLVAAKHPNVVWAVIQDHLRGVGDRDVARCGKAQVPRRRGNRTSISDPRS